MCLTSSSDKEKQRGDCSVNTRIFYSVVLQVQINAHLDSRQLHVQASVTINHIKQQQSVCLLCFWP